MVNEKLFIDPLRLNGVDKINVINSSAGFPKKNTHWLQVNGLIGFTCTFFFFFCDPFVFYFLFVSLIMVMGERKNL